MPNRTHVLNRSHTRIGWVMALLIATAVLRGGTIAARWNHLSDDPDGYRLIAENLVQRGAYSRTPVGEPLEPTAYRPPLYPLMLAGVAWKGQVLPVAVAMVHVLMATLTVYLVLVLAEKWGLGKCRWLAAVLVAVDPILLNQSAEVMTETLATLLAVVCLLALSRWAGRGSPWAALLAGLVLGSAALCRPTFLVWAVFCAIFFVMERRSWDGGRQAVLLLAAAVVALLPWAIRNHAVMGRGVWATTHGGYTLLLGNNVYFYEHLRRSAWGQVWDARQLQPLLRESAELNRKEHPTEHPELANDRRLYKIARQTIRDHPVRFIYSSLVRVGRLWTPLPHRLDANESVSRAAARWSVAAWYTVCFALALFGAWRWRRRVRSSPWIWGLGCVLAFTLVHSVYWSNMRMRAPVMPVVYLAAAAACVRTRLEVD